MQIQAMEVLSNAKKEESGAKQQQLITLSIVDEQYDWAAPHQVNRGMFTPLDIPPTHQELCMRKLASDGPAVYVQTPKKKSPGRRLPNF